MQVTDVDPQWDWDLVQNEVSFPTATQKASDKGAPEPRTQVVPPASPAPKQHHVLMQHLSATWADGDKEIGA